MKKENETSRSIPAGNNQNFASQSSPYQIYSANQLIAAQFAPPEFIVPDLITPGLNILAGKPKMGKSLLSMNIAAALMDGADTLGTIETDPRGVLYLALEDTPQRMKTKFETILNGYEANDRVHFAFQWTRMDANFFLDLEAFLKDYPETKLVIIDTYTKVRGKKRLGSTLYEKDYNEAALLKSFADEHKIAILLIHHLRKSESKDILDMITGSVGLTGAADTILVLTRGRGEGDAILYVTGRDIEETALGLKFNKQTLTWEISGSAAEQKMSTERLEIYELLSKSDNALKLSEIADALGKKKPVTHKHLAALIADGLVEQPRYGLYQVVKVADSGESGEIRETVPQQVDIIRD